MERVKNLVATPKQLGFASFHIDQKQWQGSFNGRESTLHQLSPYIGKLKTGMAASLIDAFSSPGDLILDQFCGSGVVPFEALVRGRKAIANDLNPYAYTITRGKLEAPQSREEALRAADGLLNYVERQKKDVDLRKIPSWVRQFFHPETLRETVTAFRKATQDKDFFLLACLLGILHHQRPGFLSYPSSHLVPYLRDKLFPRDKYPELYKYRDLRSRLIAKINRAYRNPRLPANGLQERTIFNDNAKALALPSNSVDVIITSPPYFNALSYARDNRLRLWFLGSSDWKAVDNNLTSKAGNYLSEMSLCLKEMHRVLKPGSFCVLILGDVQNNGKNRNTARLISTLAQRDKSTEFQTLSIVSNKIPDKRRSRRNTKTTKIERILVLGRL